MIFGKLIGTKFTAEAYRFQSSAASNGILFFKIFRKLTAEN
jgi:hypothetical protein